jgi:hypothetical protein
MDERQWVFKVAGRDTLSISVETANKMRTARADSSQRVPLSRGCCLRVVVGVVVVARLVVFVVATESPHIGPGRQRYHQRSS